jgi:hypothetical protein
MSMILNSQKEHIEIHPVTGGKFKGLSVLVLTDKPEPAGGFPAQARALLDRSTLEFLIPRLSLELDELNERAAKKHEVVSKPQGPFKPRLECQVCGEQGLDNLRNSPCPSRCPANET